MVYLLSVALRVVLGVRTWPGTRAPPQDALAATQRRNGRAFSSLTARGGGLPVGVKSVDTLREKYGKHTVFLGASFLAHQSAQHDGERGHLPERRRELLPGETARKRLGIPMFLGEVT